MTQYIQKVIKGPQGTDAVEIKYIKREIPMQFLGMLVKWMGKIKRLVVNENIDLT